jgi:hypothetical protein
MDKIKDKIRLIKYLQKKDYIERAVQINAYQNYDNYLDYYVCEKVDPLKYLKIRLKSKLSKTEDCLSETQALLKQIDPEEYVCVISPFYQGKKMDGYYKRIEQADLDVLKGHKMIYLDYTQLGNRKFSISRYDNDHIVICFNSFNDDHLKCIESIIKAVRKIYIHSVHVLMPDIVNYNLLDIIFDDNNRTVLDLHGAVSEELKQFDTDERAKLAEDIEEIAISLSDKVVCMSQAMKDYNISKYDIDPDKLVVMSIMPFKNVEEKAPEKPENEIENVVYAGGIQKWQNIDLIKEAVRNNPDRFNFRIFTHDSEQLKKDWADLVNQNLLIDTRSNDDIYREYRDCDFGFLLRDDTVVNNVACPTKMMEYLRYGIVPILKSDHIGNFKEYGLKYVGLDDFGKGNIPDYEERKKMIENNHQILLRIIEQSVNGQNELIDYLK